MVGSLYPAQLSLLRGVLRPDLILWLHLEAIRGHGAGTWRAIERWSASDAAGWNRIDVLRRMLELNRTLEVRTLRRMRLNPYRRRGVPLPIYYDFRDVALIACQRGFVPILEFALQHNLPCARGACTLAAAKEGHQGVILRLCADGAGRPCAAAAADSGNPGEEAGDQSILAAATL